ncbi:hypothetical protein NW755_011903 [Fusarium falciforme]|uniref:chitin synthase n=1 Tax=Fusarium falciforme TaxID=195108 RepID=A0A9W8UX11_9HYPO|nr:hypothetical protein NW755_011903 [Fusarium falciforme]
MHVTAPSTTGITTSGDAPQQASTKDHDASSQKTAVEQPPPGPRDTVETCGYPPIEDPVDPARILTPRDLRNQRIIFLGIIILINICMTVTAFFGKKSKLIFVTILFIKSKDFLSAILSPLGMMATAIYHKFRPPKEVSQLWILSLIPAYSESEEQIVKTIYSLRDNGVEPHRQVMVVILDGKPRDVRSHMTRVVSGFERPYVSLKWKKGCLRVLAGFMMDVPVIVIEKVKNAGKKDSLILCHDLFNYARDNSPLYTKLLRKEIWEDILPALTEGEKFNGFDMVFCTDADSTIYKGAVALLANAIARDKNAIAACGLVLVELEPGEEMAGAIRKYAEPVTGYMVISHQVQYLGTDRRLTYSMLSQGKHLRTLFVPDAVSETVAPQSIAHYLSQRRRWGSNAYFNNYFYLAGEKMIPLTRIAATIEVVRLSMVYYRVLNTILFIKSLTHHASIMKLMPMLIIGQVPSVWFFCSILLESELRKLWGMSGVTASSAPPAGAPATTETETVTAPPTNDELSAAERGEITPPKPVYAGPDQRRDRVPSRAPSTEGYDIE